MAGRDAASQPAGQAVAGRLRRWSAGHRRRGCRRAEGLLVRVVALLPAVAGRRGGAADPRLEAIEADVPAGPVPGRLADVTERVSEREQAAVAVRCQGPAQDVLAPAVGQDAGRVDLQALA